MPGLGTNRGSDGNGNSALGDVQAENDVGTLQVGNSGGESIVGQQGDNGTDLQGDGQVRPDGYMGSDTRGQDIADGGAGLLGADQRGDEGGQGQKASPRGSGRRGGRRTVRGKDGLELESALEVSDAAKIDVTLTKYHSQLFK